MEAKEPEKREKIYEVTILDRTFISVYPKLAEEHRQSLVTYTTEELTPGTVTLDLFELFGERQKEAETQIKAREGDLWKKYLEEEKKAIRKDIEARIAIKPEIYKV